MCIVHFWVRTNTKPSRQESFKTSIGVKASTHIRPLKPSDKADLFEGFWDCLSWLEMNKLRHPAHHCFVLNSTSFSGEACTKVIGMQEEIQSVFLFMDNDVAGDNATDFIASELEPYNFNTGCKRQLYKNNKDLSNYWAQTSTL